MGSSNLPSLFEDSDLSGLPITNLGDGRPWSNSGFLAVGDAEFPAINSAAVLAALGYVPAADSDVVHTTGNETIAGRKVFEGPDGGDAYGNRASATTIVGGKNLYDRGLVVKIYPKTDTESPHYPYGPYAAIDIELMSETIGLSGKALRIFTNQGGVRSLSAFIDEGGAFKTRTRIISSGSYSNAGVAGGEDTTINEPLGSTGQEQMIGIWADVPGCLTMRAAPIVGSTDVWYLECQDRDSNLKIKFWEDGSATFKKTVNSLNSYISGAVNSENLLTPMPHSADASGRNKINDAGLTTVTACTVVGAGAVSQALRVASEARTTPGNGPAFYLSHFVDDDLSSDPTIIVATVIGAYDQLCNSTGSSVVCSPHSMILHSDAGHNNIFGGAANLVSGETGLSLILGGENNHLHDTVYGLILGGKNTGINGGTYSTAVGCNGAIISSTASLHVGGTGTYSGTGNITNGGVTVCSGNYSLVGGLGAKHSGTSALTVGDNVTNSDLYATVLGKDGVSLSPSSLTISTNQLTTKGDVAYCIRPSGAISTDGSQQPIIFIDFPTTVNGAGNVTLNLVGKIVGTNSVIGFNRTFAFWMNGDDYQFGDALGSGFTLHRDVDVNIGGLTLAGGNVGKVQISSVLQWLFIYTPGYTNPATTVKWSGSVQVTFTREDLVS